MTTSNGRSTTAPRRRAPLRAKPNGAPSCGIIAYQPRRFRGALSDSRDASPSQAPPSAKPWLTRQTPRRKMLAAPI